ncbi:MAG: DDE-type integrase/transposase/recombinase, partial [Candidatus Methanofastidiosia archaeon]
CRVPKLFRHETSSNEIMVKLANRRIKWAIDQVVKHKRSTKSIANIYNVSQRRIQQLVKLYKDTGEYPELKMKGRPKTYLSEEQKEVIENAYKESSLGARLLRHHIKKHYGLSIPQNKIHDYLKRRGYAHPDPKKQGKRKRCRYERKHSLSLIHADWIEFEGKKVIAFLDDASRYILSLGEFENATSKNTIKVLKEAEHVAESVNGVIHAVNTDRGSQFYANKKGRRGKGKSRFQRYLERWEIKHIPSRRNNPQTNGKLERWFREYKRHRNKFESSKEFSRWYNRRIHGALDLEIGETPEEAFIRRLRPEALCGILWKRMKE